MASKTKCSGPGYASPLEATKADREKLIYVTCVAADWKESGRPDFLGTVDVDPESPTYSEIVHRLNVPYVGDELHHTGWNACSSCKDPSVHRNRFIMPGLNSDRIYIVDVSNSRQPAIFKIVEPTELYSKGDASAPHTVHCLPSGEIMISCLGNAEGTAGGTFILLDQSTFEVKHNWQKEGTISRNYDYWYQPRHNIMVSTEWAAPHVFRRGFQIEDFQNGLYGESVTFWDYSERKQIKTVALGADGKIPLEVRFLHNPDSSEGFVGCAFSSTIVRLFKSSSTGEWDAEKVISIPTVKVQDWCLDEMPGLITDILISMDDRFLYLSNWIQGDIRQYNISDTKQPCLVGQIYLGGCINRANPVTKVENVPDENLSIKCKPVRGGPQMLQLSLDGKRLYVTNSLFSAWDKQFYPENLKNGSMMLQIDVDVVNGGLTLNPDFLVDFGSLDDGPVLAHEMRFPGGDCTSDIWI